MSHCSENSEYGHEETEPLEFFSRWETENMENKPEGKY